jgi:SOS-response transcriptional repressor LexA
LIGPGFRNTEKTMGVKTILGDPPTRRQAEVLEFIRHHTREHGRPPTIREIGRGVGVGTTNGVLSLVKPLRRKGYIAPTDGTSRGIRLLARDGSLLCPHCGQPTPKGLRDFSTS